MTDNEKLIERLRASGHDRDRDGICRACGHGLTAAEMLDDPRPCVPQGDPSDADLDALYEAFKAHDRGVEFNELGEHVCKECGYAWSWPEGEQGRYVTPPRRLQRHIAREALRAAGGVR